MLFRSRSDGARIIRPSAEGLLNAVRSRYGVGWLQPSYPNCFFSVIRTKDDLPLIINRPVFLYSILSQLSQFFIFSSPFFWSDFTRSVIDPQNRTYHFVVRLLLSMLCLLAVWLLSVILLLIWLAIHVASSPI